MILLIKTSSDQNWSEEAFIITKIKDTVSRTYVISDLNGESITGSFYEKETHKTIQEKLGIEKVLKRRGDKLYVKWKRYNNSFNSWINKKTLNEVLSNAILLYINESVLY